MLYLNANPPLMTVRVDGHEETRRIRSYDTVTHRYEPELEDHEECLWYPGNPVPTIVQVRPKAEEVPALDYDWEFRDG